MKLFELSNTVAIITGASTGLGKGMSLGLAEAGADVVLVDYVSSEETAEEIKAMGRKAISLEANLMSIQPIPSLIEETIRKFGKVDILVNNAGLAHPNHEIVKLPLAEWQEVIETNLTGLFLVTRAALVLMQGGGTIGCIMTQLLYRGGISKVILSEPVAHRREIAKAVGATLVVDPKTEDLPAILKRETNGLGPEYVFDCVGHHKLIEEGIQLVQKGGTIFVVGVADPAGVANIKPYDLFAKELTIKASCLRPYTFARAVRYLPYLNLKPIVSVEYPLEKTKEAIHALRQSQMGCKILVKP